MQRRYCPCLAVGLCVYLAHWYTAKAMSLRVWLHKCNIIPTTLAKLKISLKGSPSRFRPSGSVGAGVCFRLQSSKSRAETILSMRPFWGTSLNGYKFEWIGTKFQLADKLTKRGMPGTFSYLWSLKLIDVNNHKDGWFISHIRGVMISRTY